MARRKKNVDTNEDEFNDMMGSLLKGTSNSSLVSDSAMMHDRPKVETPIPELNAFLAGGLPLGCMIECYGDPSAGKSSFAYQTLGNFQHEYPDGIGLIVDTEASVDRTRMAYMGANDDQTIRVSSDTIEVGFSEVFKILDNKLNSKELKDKPMFILWDTISLASTEKQFENKESMNGGGNDAQLVA